MESRLVLVLALSSLLVGACATPSKEGIRVQIMEQTKSELSGASLESLISLAEARGVDVAQARVVQTAAPAVRAAGEAATKDQLVGEIAEDKAEDEATATKQFYGVSFGIAPSVLFGGPEEVRAANIVDQGGTPIVQVTESRDDTTAVLLEAHYFFQPSKILDTYEWGFGPFLGIQVTEDDVLQGLGFGGMIGFRYAEDSSRSFNIGLGLFLDEDVQTLASGFSDGQAPAGETQVRFEEEDAWRGVLMFSFAWGI